MPLLFAPETRLAAADEDAKVTHAVYVSPINPDQLLVALDDGTVAVHPTQQVVIQRKGVKVLRLRSYDETCLALWNDGVLSYGSHLLYQLDVDNAFDFALVYDEMLRRVVVFVGGERPTLSRFIVPEPSRPASFFASLLSFVAPSNEISDLSPDICFDDDDRCVTRVEVCPRLLAALDNFGRLLVCHAGTLTVLHILRGYRSATFGFLYEPGHPSSALVVVERRRVLEVWDRARLMSSTSMPANVLLVCDDEGRAALVDPADTSKCTPIAPPSTSELECVRLIRAYCTTGSGQEPVVAPEDLKRLSNAALERLLEDVKHIDMNSSYPLSWNFHRQLTSAAQSNIKDDGKAAALRAECATRLRALDAWSTVQHLAQVAQPVPAEAPPLAAVVARKLSVEPAPQPQRVAEWMQCFAAGSQLTSSVADVLYGPLLRGDVVAAKQVIRVEESMGSRLHDDAFASWWLSRPVERAIAEPINSRAVVSRLYKADADSLLLTVRTLACGPLGLSRAWLLAECLGRRAEAEKFRIATAVAMQLEANDVHVESVENAELLGERLASAALHHGLDYIPSSLSSSPASPNLAAASTAVESDVFTVDPDFHHRVQKVLRLVPEVDGANVRDRLMLGWAEKKAWPQVALGLKHGASAQRVWPMVVAAKSVRCTAECLRMGPDKKRAAVARLLALVHASANPSSDGSSDSTVAAEQVLLMEYLTSADFSKVAPQPDGFVDAVLGLLPLVASLESALEFGRELELDSETVCSTLAVRAFELGNDDVGLDALAQVDPVSAPGFLSDKLLSVAARRLAVVLDLARHDREVAPLLALVSPKTTSWVLGTPGARPKGEVSLPQTHTLLAKAQALGNKAPGVSAKFAELIALVETIWVETRGAGTAGGDDGGGRSAER